VRPLLAMLSKRHGRIGGHPRAYQRVCCVLSVCG
jgi:hypothetical protein